MSSAPDDVLHLLRQRGRHPDPSALDALMRGVAAAPEGLAGPEWVELVDPSADPELTRALKAWREELARADDGLGA
jgi:Xaa-Pro aminopeptidase